MTLCVLNASFPVRTEIELDEYVDYRQGIDSCFSDNKIVKKCISWHSIAAACETEFFVINKNKWQDCFKYDKILVLIREDLERVKPLLSKLKLMKKKIILGFHENTSHFLMFCQDLNWLKKFKELLDLSDYYWNSNYSISDFISSISDIKIYNGTHGVPHQIANSFMCPKNERKDIMIGTTTFSQWLPRNTMPAIGSASRIAKRINCKATLVVTDSVNIDDLSKLFLGLGIDNLNIIKGPLKYEEWLRTIAKHKAVIHCDQSDTLGQIVADSCSVMVPCYGGNSYNNFLAGTNSFMFNIEEKILQDLESNDDCWFNFELLKWETSYNTIRKKHETFFV